MLRTRSFQRARDRTMGVWERPTPAFLDALEREFHFFAAARAWLDSQKAVNAMHAGQAGVFVSLVEIF